MHESEQPNAHYKATLHNSSIVMFNPTTGDSIATSITAVGMMHRQPECLRHSHVHHSFVGTRIHDGDAQPVVYCNIHDGLGTVKW